MAFLAVWTLGRPAPPADPTYTGSVNLRAKEEAGGIGPESGGELGFYAFVAAETPEIAGLVAAELGEGVYPDDQPTREAILESLEVTELPEISTMTLTFQSQPSERVATQVVDRFAFHLVEYARGTWVADYEDRLATLAARETELRETINRLTAELDALSVELTEEEVRAGVSPDVIKDAERDVALESLAAVISEADSLRSLSEEERTPLQVSGSPVIAADVDTGTPLGFEARLALAVALGALLGVGLTFGLHRFDTRLFNRKDAEAAFRLPVLAEVPRIRWYRRRRHQLVTASDPGARASEAYRLLRSSIGRIHRLHSTDGGVPSDGGGLVILVASAAEGVGKSSTAANLAVASVDAGKATLLIGADLRRPTVERFFDLRPRIGLTDCVDEMEEKGIDSVDLDRYLQPTKVAGITFLGSGHPVPNPGERLAAARPIVEALRQRFDVIVIDSPAMLAGNDVSEIVPYVDVVLLLARVGATTIEEAQWSRETAERMQAPVCGVALIGSTSGIQRRRAYGRRVSPAGAGAISRTRKIRHVVGSMRPDTATPTAESHGRPTSETADATPSDNGSTERAPADAALPDISDLFCREYPEDDAGEPIGEADTGARAAAEEDASGLREEVVATDPVGLDLVDEDEANDSLAPSRPDGSTGNGTNTAAQS